MNPRCQWPGCECEATGPKYCDVHRVEARRARQREYAQRRRDEHRDEMNAYARAWRTKNRDRVLANAKKPERAAKHRAQVKAWRDAHRDKIRAMWRTFYWRHRDGILEGKKLRRAARVDPGKFMRLKAKQLQYCKRLHLRAMELPCGKTEACSGCERIGGKRIGLRETGFEFGSVGG